MVSLNNHTLVEEFQAYSQWRSSIIEEVQQLQNWLKQQEITERTTDTRFSQLLHTLKEDKLHVAFVAEFSRGKSELINAIFFGDYGHRILPSSAGRTTMCPTELFYNPAQASCIQLLPISTRHSHLSMQDYKDDFDAWTKIEINTQSTEQMQLAFSKVSETCLVDSHTAQEYGLFDPASPDYAFALRPDGQVEIPAWRHAMINFPHPLLKQGLVILDTPGLNALGSEPELTLNLLPKANAVVFILSADTGLTKSDHDIWRHHIADKYHSQRGRLIVLNKIDSMWDDLKTPQAIENEIQKQITTTAKQLGVPTDCVFPVSAQKALLAKIQEDEDLFMKSGLEPLEIALSEQLIPAKQDIMRDNTRREIEAIVQTANMQMNSHHRAVSEQLTELYQLRGKNRHLLQTLVLKIQTEKTNFEHAMQHFQALRSIFSHHTSILIHNLNQDNLRREMSVAQTQMESSPLSFGENGLRSSMDRFFRYASAKMRETTAQVTDIQNLVANMSKKFTEDYQFSQCASAPFSTLKFHKELSRLERDYHEKIGSFSAFLTFGKKALMRKFFDTIASQVFYLFQSAQEELDLWLKTQLVPIEGQIRDHQKQLRHRLESVKRIHQSSHHLEERIQEMQAEQQEAQRQMMALETKAHALYQHLQLLPHASVTAHY